MIIERKEYLNKLITWKDKQLIKIVTINFEDLDYEELTNYKKLYNYLKEILYLIFDYPHKHYTFKYFEV